MHLNLQSPVVCQQNLSLTARSQQQPGQQRGQQQGQQPSRQRSLISIYIYIYIYIYIPTAADYLVNQYVYTVYPKKYAHSFVVLCFVVVMQSFIMNSHEVFIHIHQGCFAGTGAIVRLPQCQWSKPDGYGKISQCITTTTKHSKAKTVCIFLGIYCTWWPLSSPRHHNHGIDHAK